MILRPLMRGGTWGPAPSTAPERHRLTGLLIIIADFAATSAPALPPAALAGAPKEGAEVATEGTDPATIALEYFSVTTPTPAEVAAMLPVAPACTPGIPLKGGRSGHAGGCLERASGSSSLLDCRRREDSRAKRDVTLSDNS